MSDIDRYHRQRLLPGFGDGAQERLMRSSALLVGCGALGTVIAESLVRAGVGRLVVVDRDIVELTNLQRQVLFDENDVRDGTPKAIAAARRLGRINSDVEIEAHVADFDANNAERLARGRDVIVDGTDNFETRFLLNDLSVKTRTPYVYGGAVGTRGMTMVVLPDDGPCLRCVFDEAPAPGSAETCDTAGVLGPAVGVIANLQATEALKLLTGNEALVSRALVTIDPWQCAIRKLGSLSRVEDCPCCGARRFDYFHGDQRSRTFTMCGRNAVQIAAPGNGGGQVIDTTVVANRLAAHGEVTSNEHLVRAELPEGDNAYQITLFADGRAIVHGTDDPGTAKSIYARYIGS